MLYNATFSKSYGLRKIHKTQLKPIILSIDYPNSKVSQFLTDILTKRYSSEKTYYIKNCTDFPRFVCNITLSGDFVIISLDVVSLFTKILKDLVKSSIESGWDNIKYPCDIPKEHLLKRIDFIFDSTEF